MILARPRSASFLPLHPIGIRRATDRGLLPVRRQSFQISVLDKLLETRDLYDIRALFILHSVRVDLVFILS